MEYVITDKMKALEKALNDLGFDHHYMSCGAYCIDNKTHYGSEITVGFTYNEEATLVFTPDGKLVDSWLECPTDEKSEKKKKKKKI